VILLQKATTNEDVIFTLSENTTLTSPYYLFEFTSEGNTSYTCISADLATVAQQARFNKFTFIEGVDDRTNGSLILGNTGVYRVNVYEQASSTNLDVANATFVEYTMMRLIDSETSNYVSHEIVTEYIDHVI
jgi:hypothetical protein